MQNSLITTCASPVFPSGQVTPKIDVWALGVLLFQIVFKGALPFAEVRPHGSVARLFNNIVVEIELCPIVHASILLLKVPGGQLGKIFAFASLNHPVQLPSTEGLDPTLLDTIRS